MLKVIKIGGNIVDNPEKLDRFLSDFVNLEGDKVLVHGGGKVATKISAALGIETRMIDGRRVTDAETIQVVTMVYAGLVNKTITARLNALGCGTIGLSGADGRLILSKKRPPVMAGEPPAMTDFGLVGDPMSVNTDLLSRLTSEGYTVAIAPITADHTGQLLNTNADTVASTLAIAMARVTETHLVFCFEKEGVLRDVDDPASLIPVITPGEHAELKAQGVVHTGMLPKLDNAFKAIEKGVASVSICNAESISQPGCGTKLIG